MEEQLWSACADGKVEDVRKFLQNEEINKANQNDGSTPLYIACEYGHIEIVKLLLNDNRVDINKATNGGHSPFWIACYRGHIDIVKLLLNDNRVDFNKANTDDQTPFFFACWNGHIEIVKLLLNDERVDINKSTDDSITPFSIACQYGHIEIVIYMLACGREIDINKKDEDGKTGLDYAKERGREEMQMDELDESDDEWENEKDFQETKKIVKLIESFERNQNETRFQLRIQLGLAGKSLFCIFFNFLFKKKY
mgnify:CR=1 FL=1